MAKKKETQVAKVEERKYTLTPTWIEEKQVLKMLQKTPKEHVYKRPGKGGQQWEYVTVAFVQKVLNYVFGWNWDFEIVSQQLVGDKGAEQIVTLGKLTVKDDHGHTITKTQFGRKDVAYRKDSKIYLDLGNDYKASASDSLKKCASLLGIASDIYGKEEFREIKQEAKQPTPTKSEVAALPAKSTPTPFEKSLHDFYLYAVSKGAVKGDERKFVESTLGETVDWDNLKIGDINVLKMKLMSKTVKRNNGEENAESK